MGRRLASSNSTEAFSKRGSLYLSAFNSPKWVVATQSCTDAASCCSKAVARALPSLGSVPAPTSSSSTRAGAKPSPLRDCSDPIAARIRAIRFTWPLKVERFCCSDCSSPISAKTAAHHGTFAVPTQGKNNPARAIRAARPRLLSATVLPPVLGPVIATTLKLGSICRLTGTTGRPPSRRSCHISNGWRNSRNCQCWPPSSGFTAPSQLLYRARARPISSRPKHFCKASNESISAPTAALSCSSMRRSASRSCASSSAMRLPREITTCGSIKTVPPEAELS